MSFFRSIFRGNSQRNAEQAQSTGGMNDSEHGRRDEAVAAEAAAFLRDHGLGTGLGLGNGAGGGGGAGGADPLATAAETATVGDGADGAEGSAHSAIRDLMNFLSPTLNTGAGGGIASLERALASVGGTMVNGLGTGRLRNRRRLHQPTTSEAREELQIKGLVLAPHQVMTRSGIDHVLQ